VSIKIYDPSLRDAVFANLVANEDGEGFSLIWSRPVRQDY